MLKFWLLCMLKNWYLHLSSGVNGTGHKHSEGRICFRVTHEETCLTDTQGLFHFNNFNAHGKKIAKIHLYLIADHQWFYRETSLRAWYVNHVCPKQCYTKMGKNRLGWEISSWTNYKNNIEQKSSIKSIFSVVLNYPIHI